MAKQLHIFAENKPGRFEAVTELLGSQKINILAFTIQNRGEFGLLKLLVDDPQKAYRALVEKGYACALKDIVLISVEDKPGNLHKLTKLLFQNNINISDTFGFVLTTDKVGICSLEVDYPQNLKGLLEKEGFKVLEENTF